MRERPAGPLARNTFYLQCVAGLQAVVSRELRNAPFGPVEVILEEDGLVVFSAGASSRHVEELPYANNCFLVLLQSEQGGIEEGLRLLTVNRDWAHQAINEGPVGRSFRLFLSDGGRLVPGPGRAVWEAVDTIAKATGLRFEPRQADTEFWLLRRSSGLVFFCKRLTRRSRTEKDLARGELRPEFAHLLCALSEPDAHDVFLDPFAGSGAIPLARSRWPFDMILASDIDEAQVSRLKQRVKQEVRTRRGSPVIVRLADATRLERISAGFIDKIVTDPPWGYFDADLIDIEGFYRRFTLEFSRVTKPGGLVVMVIGRREVANALAESFSSDFDVEGTFEVLVAGKKAVVMKMRRRDGTCTVDIVDARTQRT